MSQNMELYSVLKDFYRISGIRVSIHDTEFHEIYAYPAALSPYCECLQENPKIKKACLGDDAAAFQTVKKSGEVLVYKCKRGLYEVVAPIYHYGVLSGYLMMGQIRSSDSPSLGLLEKRAYEILKDHEKAAALAASVQAISREKLDAYIHLMTIVAEYLTGKNKLHMRNERLPQLTAAYLNRNYGTKITLEGLAQKFGCCKSTLTHGFKQEYGTSVMEYLTCLRMSHAKEELTGTDRSIKEIAADCGFYDQNHFSKTFLKRFGCLPSEYRERQ